MGKELISHLNNYIRFNLKELAQVFFSVVLSLLPILGMSNDEGVFGPQRFQRDFGKPRWVEASFSVSNISTPYQLVIQVRSSDELNQIDKTLVSLSSIEINGVELDWQVRRIIRRYESNSMWQVPILLEKENTLRVMLRGQPESEVTISITP